MSNEVIAALKNSIATIPTGGVDDDTRAVAGASGNKRISIKGGVFRKIAAGKEVGNIEDRQMNIIFVKMAHHPSRTLYEGAYREGEKVSPSCWSNDAKTPDPAVAFPPAPTCEKCPNAVKGSGQGGKGTACRLSWRTAVVLPNQPEGDVMQLVLPATSVFGKEDGGRWPFKAYVQMLANNNISAGRVVTKMSFDTKFPVPRVLFSPVGAVEEEDLPIILKQSQTEEAQRAITLTVYQADEGDAPAEPAEPVVPVGTSEEGTDSDVPEPTLRKAEPAAPVNGTTEVAAVINKWKKAK